MDQPLPSLCHSSQKQPHYPISRLTKALRLAWYLGASTSLLLPGTTHALTCPVSSPIAISTDDSNAGNCTIESLGTVDINFGGHLSNLTNAQLNNFGKLRNLSGSFTNQQGASLNNAGTLVNITGGYTLETRPNGTYGVLSGRSFTNSGTLTNQQTGSINNTVDGLFVNDGSLSNFGNMENQAGNRVVSQRCPIQTYDYSYSWSNTYFACGLSTSSGVVNNNNFINQSGGTFTNATGALLDNYGNLSNSGTLKNYAGNRAATHKCPYFSQGTFMTYVSFRECAWDLNAGIRNQGTLRNETEGILVNSGLLANYNTVQNAGILNNSGAIDNKGLLVNESGGHFLNEVTGRISIGRNASGTISPYITNHIDGTIVNDGMLDNHGTIRLNAGTFTNNGTLNNSTTGIISIPHYGPDVPNKDFVNNGIMNNAGQADSIINNGTLGNTGQADYIINNSTLENTGQTTSIVNNGTLNNTGTIERITDSVATSNLTNSGAISTLITYGMAKNTGTVNHARLMAGGHMINSGTINGVDLRADATVNNSGTLNRSARISGTLTNSNYILAEGFTSTYIDYYGYGSPREYTGSTILQVNDTGLLNNDGYIVVKDRSSILVAGQAVNHGSIDSLGSDISIDTQASMVGSGTVTLQESYSTILKKTYGSQLEVNGSLSQGALLLGDRSTLYGTGTITTTNGAPIGINALSKINPGEQPTLSGFDLFTYTRNNNGTLPPEPPPTYGTLSFGSDISLAGELVVEVAGINSFDILQIFGAIHFEVGSLITFDFSNYLPTTGDQFNFLLADTVSGEENLDYAFVGLDTGALNLYPFLALTESQDLRLSFRDAEVPLPASLWLFGSGLAGLMGLRGRNKRK